MKLETEFSLFNDIIDGLKQAEGATSQLVHVAGNPVGFMIIRDALALAREGCMRVAPQNVLLSPKTFYKGMSQ